MADLKVLVSLLAIAIALTESPVGAQSPTSPPAPASATRPTTGPSATATLKPEEVEQIVAPIALYPDSLLAQVLMASTYPLEIVQADRWLKANPTLKDNAEELNKLPWDPSVKSLLDFPQVLTMMSEKLDWTVKLGDAFIADQKPVMDAIQRLRGKAYAQGNLKTNSEQKVTVEPAAPATAPAAQVSVQTTTPAPQVIVIESASPSVVYVPTYNPTVVYGAWPYPAYPPAYYYPPGYVAATSMISFGVGVAVGAAWGHAWGGCGWHSGDVNVNVNRNANFNQTINRQNYQAKYNNANRTTARGGGGNSFQHDASHRQGVAYRDSATNERYRGAGASQQTAQARDSYRGRAEAGRSEINRGAADAYRGNGGNAGGSARGGAGNRSAGGASPQSAERSRQAAGSRSSGFGGVDSGGANTRAASNRGQASRGGSYSGGNRGGGGAAARGGGGRGGGRR